MKHLRLVSKSTKINFLGARYFSFSLSAIMAVSSIVLLSIVGLNFGIDFKGGILIEIRTAQQSEIGKMRSSISDLGLGDISIQEFGDPRDVLIRIEEQPGGEQGQLEATNLIKEALVTNFGDVEFRRVEFVGPKVSSELIKDGVLALALAIGAMMIYIWLRFEWQFGLGAVIAITHDVLLTLGVFSLLQLEFNLSIIAAILTIIGYSINDTVVIYDRIRENLRKYRSFELIDLLNRSANETLSRTLMTSGTTLLALIALFLFGGAVIKGFTFAMIWGVLIGTYSSVFVASPLLLYLRIDRGPKSAEE